MSKSEIRYTAEHIAEARDLVTRIFVAYRQVNEVNAELVRRFQAGSRAQKVDLASSARLTVLSAPSGCGKTSALAMFLKNPDVERNALGHKVLYVALPPQCTIKSLTSEFLRALGDPLADRVSTAARNTARVVQCVQELGYKLILIDEFQHLLDRDSGRVAHVTTDWLKSMLDHAAVPVVCAGLSETLQILRSNEQLERRMTKIIMMKPMQWDNADSTTEFRYFLREFERQLPMLTEASELHEPQMAYAIYQATGGLPGRVAQLIAEALEVSMLRSEGPDHITRADFARAFAALTFDRNNPFDGSPARESNVRGPAVLNNRGRGRAAGVGAVL